MPDDKKDAGLSDGQIEWLSDMAAQGAELADALGVSVREGTRTLLLAQRVTARHIADGVSTRVALADMPTPPGVS